MPRLEDYMSQANAARRLGISRQRMNQLVEAGVLPSIRHEGRTLVERKAVEAYAPDRDAQRYGRRRGK